MNDYRATEPTMCGDVCAKEVTVKDGLQETNKILHELSATLDDLLVNVCGETAGTDVPSEANNLLEESRRSTGAVYDCLQKANRLRRALI